MQPNPVLQFIQRLIQGLIHLFTLQWLADILALIRALIADLRRRREAKDDRRGRPVKCEPRCATVPASVYKRADPLIYSQYYLMEQGLAVTWDNPDIQLYENGIAVSSNLVKPDTDYEIEARIFNNSIDAPAIGLPVYFSYLSFGIGIQSNPITAVKINLPIKGAPGHPAFAKIPWRTPKLKGHYCLQVRLDWPDDANPKNNLGQENLNVGESHSPADFVFPVRNDDTIAKRIVLNADAYVIPDLPNCDDRPKPAPVGKGTERPTGRVGAFIPPSERKADWNGVRRRHAPSAFPIPAGWTVAIEPKELALTPGQQKNVKVSITPPSGFRGERAFNVNATYGGGLLGGVTLNVRKA